MSLFRDLIGLGYLPENLPPSFSSRGIAGHFGDHLPTGYYTNSGKPSRVASYNASKRGGRRRKFSAIHPSTAVDVAHFVVRNWEDISGFLEKSVWSLSRPVHRDSTPRALTITTYSELEKEVLTRLSKYRYIATTDISRFYHSIYTHSLPWAYHGKGAAKEDRNVRSAKVFFNRVDRLTSGGQDGQTLGIPVGPDTSRVLAEVVATAIDLEFAKSEVSNHVGVVRHVDDIWIGGDTHERVAEALFRYRAAMHMFELDINEQKTNIYSADFRFSEAWPTEISSAFDLAIESSRQKREERLRSAFEKAFRYANNGDDGVLRYAIRYLDRSELHWREWNTVEPYLKRAAVHYGHTIDFVVRILVWLHVREEELDYQGWKDIFLTILDHHGRLGNDSEVCWALYACEQLGLNVGRDISSAIVENCGSLAVLAVLNINRTRSVRSLTMRRLGKNPSKSPDWPIVLEWKARQWQRHNQIELDDDLIEELANKEICIFYASEKPVVFRGVAEPETVDEAIERYVSLYDEEDDDLDDDEAF